MTVTVASTRARVILATARVGYTTRAIALPNSGVLTFAASAAVPVSPQVAPYIQFPAPWQAVTDNPGIRLIIHNFSTGTPVRPTLLNANNTVFCNLHSLVEPGGGQTSWGITNEIAPGLPTTPLKLAMQNLVVGDAAGFQVEVRAWAV